MPSRSWHCSKLSQMHFIQMTELVSGSRALILLFFRMHLSMSLHPKEEESSGCKEGLCGFGMKGDWRLHFENLRSKHTPQEGACTMHMHVECWEYDTVLHKLEWVSCKREIFRYGTQSPILLYWGWNIWEEIQMVGIQRSEGGTWTLNGWHKRAWSGLRATSWFTFKLQKTPFSTWSSNDWGIILPVSIWDKRRRHMVAQLPAVTSMWRCHAAEAKFTEGC